jgi:23S rRNA pseudouridine2457 synthase
MRSQSNRTRAQFKPKAQCTYIAFNKPYGVLCQFTTPENSQKRTLAEFGFPQGVYSIGRLDYDSEGLLLLSDDAELNKTLLDPQHGHRRTYYCQIENVPDSEQLRRLATGVVIQGSMTRPCVAKLLAAEPEFPPRSNPIRVRKSILTCWLELGLSEGKNRQVRHMTAAIGCPTLRLVRVAIGKLDLDSLALKPGDWKRLTGEAITRSLL